MKNTINNKVFKNANEAYEYLHDKIIQYGVEFSNTLALFNVGFYIENPMDNHITNKERNWKHDYAEAEWQWYKSGDRNVDKLRELYGKVPQIWLKMCDDYGRVNSNYGWQWERNEQLMIIIDKLTRNHETRQAAISIYDGKEIRDYNKDTPCTYAVQFTRINGKLDMCVVMRSNDLWYGFCNDQYCFSELQKEVCRALNLEIGT